MSSPDAPVLPADRVLPATRILYFTTPFLVFAVWWRNRVEEPPTPVADLVLPNRVARLIGLVGVAWPW